MLEFKTKAETLQQLEGQVTSAKVLPQVCFTVAKLQEQPEAIWDMIQAAFGQQAVIVRSSALSEDTGLASQAGKYLSIAGCVGQAGIMEAIKQVAQAFGDGGDGNQIFIQPMLQAIARCGVIFTLEPSTGGQYYIINYDESGSTSSVTSGTGEGLQVYYQVKHSTQGDAKMAPLVQMAQELERLFDHEALDIEFAQDASGTLYILQVRPLVLKVPVASFTSQQQTLERICSKIQDANQPKPYLLGKRTIYGVMPDWNPAEMIGIRPKQLALSLYKRLITDGTWAYQRSNYGYRNLRSFPLLIDFGGLPYIDVRVSFNSFIPKELDDGLGEKLVGYYLDRLAQEPEMHDKVEFAIIFSCFTFDFAQRSKVLADHGFSAKEIRELGEALLALTNRIINVTDGLWLLDAEKIGLLEQRQRLVMESELDIVSKIYWLLEDCARYGTLPFAGLARAGFIAVQLLQSLVGVGIVSQQEYQDYMSGLDTVGSQMGRDYATMTQEDFLQKYGHLRPGTYDINSKRYDAAPELYFGQAATSADEPSADAAVKALGAPRMSDELRKPKELREPFKLSLRQYAAIGEQMKACGLQGDVLALFKFIEAAIEGREYAKFVFTKSLSDALELLAQLGEQYGISREDMAYMDCLLIDELYSAAVDGEATIKESIARGKEKYAEALGITLPPVILNADEARAFRLPDGTPNFITDLSATGELCPAEIGQGSLEGKILLLKAADPGYDWIFNQRIKGFITAYGGANSHMAIRAAELRVPAVIGIGEKQYAYLEQAAAIHIDCAVKKMEILR